MMSSFSLFHMKITASVTKTPHRDSGMCYFLHLTIFSSYTYTSWIIDNSWSIQKSPGWKPDWFLEMRLLAEKQFKNKHM